MPVPESGPADTEAQQALTAELSAVGLTDAHEVGHGGFGTVFRCEQTELGRQVAVKVLSATFDRDNFERFRREEFVMGRLSGHPNIVTILATGSLTGGRPYIVMPFHRGDSLDALIRHQGPRDWPWVVRAGVKLAGALETAHRAGILHRDVKPANILLTEYGEPQLTDFGIARIAGGFETGTGNIAGSLAFTAPEVLGGAAPSVVGDVYSLGATLYNLIAGHPAFERRPGEELVAQFLRIVRQDTPMLDVAGVPADVAAVIAAAMARDPADRPASAAALAQQLGDLLRDHGQTPEPLPIPTLPDAPGPALDGGPPTRCSIPDDLADAPSGRRLPVPLTSFVGRDRDVRRVAELFTGEARLVTLTGPGGVGKTRLALQVATRLEPSLPGGVFTVDLADVPDADQLADVVADALALGDDRVTGHNTIADLGRRLARALGDRRSLIVFENCEHLIAQCGPLIEHLLRVLPGLRLLVTSRQVLGIAGEHLHVVAPLACPDPDSADGEPATVDELMRSEAVELFLDRARAVVPDLAMTDADRMNVARLCAQLDGIPLLIELAAARLRTFGITELLQVICDRFRLLSTGAGQTRHRTLRALVDWSYQLLTDDERELWLATGLFAAEFSADAVIDLCAGPARPAAEVRCILASLVDKSMVASTPRDGGHRYRLLVTLREYAQARLAESGRREQVVARYIDRYLRLARRFRADWFTDRQVEAFTAVHDERKNLRAALTYCQDGDRLCAVGAEIVGSLHYYWLAGTAITEARRWLAQALDGPGAPQLDPSVRARALWSAAILAFLQDDGVALPRYAEAARDAAIDCGDRCCEGYAHLALGFAALSRHDVADGVGEHRRALACLREAGDDEGVVTAASGLISVIGQGGENADGAAMWREAVACCRRVGDRWHLAYLMYVFGYHRYLLGEYDAAWTAECESLRLSQPFADRVVVAYALETLSWVAARRQDFENAARLAGAAAASWTSGHAAMVNAMNSERGRVGALVAAGLGDERAAALVADGRALGPDRAVADALSGR